MKLFEDGDPCFAPMLNALFAAFRGTAVMSGCEVSATGTSRTVSITAGSVQINGDAIAVGAGSVTLDAGSTFDRYDLVSVDASGSKIVTKGTTKRKCPTQPANTCLLAIVFVPAGATVIATGDVYDARLLASQVVAAALMCSGTVTANAVGTASYTLAAGSTAPCCYQDNSSVPATKTAPPVPADRSGSVHVRYDIIGAPGAPATVWLTLNEVEVPGSRHTSENGTFDQVVTVAPGDTIGLRSSGMAGNVPYNSLFEIRAYLLLQCSAQHTW